MSSCRPSPPAPLTPAPTAKNSRSALLQDARNDLLERITQEVRTPREGSLALMDRLVTEFPAPTLERARLLTQYRQSRARLLAFCRDAARLAAAAESLSHDSAPPPSHDPERVLLRDVIQSAVSNAIEDRSLNVQLQPSKVEMRPIQGDLVLLPHGLGLLLEFSSQHASRDQPVSMTLLEVAGRPVLRIDALGRGLSTPAHDGGSARTTMPGIIERIFAHFGCSLSAEELVPPGVRFTVSFRD